MKAKPHSIWPILKQNIEKIKNEKKNKFFSFFLFSKSAKSKKYDFHTSFAALLVAAQNCDLDIGFGQTFRNALANARRAASHNRTFASSKKIILFFVEVFVF